MVTEYSTRERLRWCLKLPVPTLRLVLRLVRLTKSLPHLLELKRAANLTVGQIGSLIRRWNTVVAYLHLQWATGFIGLSSGNRFIFFVPLVTSPCLLVRNLVVVGCGALVLHYDYFYFYFFTWRGGGSGEEIGACKRSQFCWLYKLIVRDYCYIYSISFH